MANNFKELRSKMSPKAQARSRKSADQILEKMALHELRKQRRMTQADVAHSMEIGQGTVSKIEQRGATNIATLGSYVRSLGGHLEMRAVFPDKSIELTVAGESQ